MQNQEWLCRNNLYKHLKKFRRRLPKVRLTFSLLATQVYIAQCLYSNWILKISSRSIIRRCNKKAVEKHKKAKEQNAWTSAKCFQLLWWRLTVSRQCSKYFHSPATHRQIQRVNHYTFVISRHKTGNSSKLY